MPIFSTSSVPQVIDALIACFEDSLSGTAVEVFDGLPVDLPDGFVAIGGDIDPVADGEQEWAGLGNSAMNETYDVLGQISTAVGGTGTANPDATPNSLASNAQKGARDAAYAILSTITNAILNDKQLIAWGAPFQAGWVSMVRLTAQETSYNDSESEKGRRCDLKFSVRVRNRLGAIG